MNHPAIILVHPQMVENIGMAARAMANCALEEMRLVRPRDPWPLGDVHRQRLEAAASGALEILARAKLFDTLEEAIADLHFVYATTARPHDRVSRIFTPKGAAPDMRQRLGQGERVGILFGPERTGLTSDAITHAHATVTVPLNPDFTSLNLAQAVLLMGYEWYQAGDSTAAEQIRTGHSRPATHEEYQGFFRRLEEELEVAGFFVAEDMRPVMTRSLQTMLHRAAMTEQEIRTWHGVISALVTGPKRSDREGGKRS